MVCISGRAHQAYPNNYVQSILSIGPNNIQVKRYLGMGHVQMMDVNALGQSAIEFYKDVAAFLCGVFGDEDGKQEEQTHQ